MRGALRHSDACWGAYGVPVYAVLRGAGRGITIVDDGAALERAMEELRADGGHERGMSEARLRPTEARLRRAPGPIHVPRGVLSPVVWPQCCMVQAARRW